MEILENEQLGSEIEAEEQKEVVKEPLVAEKSEADEIPEKYRGKTVAEIAKMHQEAEKIISRQGQEVGEVRKLADDLLKQQLTPKVTPPAEPEIDLFEDPKGFVQKAIASSPEVQDAKKYAEQARREQESSRLAHAHPDYQAVASSQEFIDWVNKSPVRVRMAHVADSVYDANIASELMSTFKELQAVKNVKETVINTEAVKANLKSVQVDSSGTGETSKKVYRRADLIRLKMTDPERYESLSDDIYKAYAEGRVR